MDKEKIKFQCHECKHSGTLSYEDLAEKWKVDGLSPRNLGVYYMSYKNKFECKGCKETGSFQILDNDDDHLLFDTQNERLCSGCGAAIPIPRCEAKPDTDICVLCEEGEESPETARQPSWPKPPPESPRECPQCSQGVVLVRQNGNTGDRFLGCSRFPKCRWRTNKYNDDLNG